MSKVKIVAGDLDHGSWMLSSGFISKASTPDHLWKGERYHFKYDMEDVDLIDQENITNIKGSAAWGIAGAALFGPLGAIGGIVLGGKKTEVAFSATLKDGRKFMGVTDGKGWKKISASRF